MQTPPLPLADVGSQRRSGDFLARVKPAIDRTIRGLAKIRFRGDPIVIDKYAINASIVMSATKRHGKIIELALRERLLESNRHLIWSEPKFLVSHAADHIINAQSERDHNITFLAYGDNTVRTLQIDMIVFDVVDQLLRSYEIKRANGHHDNQTTRNIKRNLACVQMLLKSYGQRNKFHACDPLVADSHIIAYYGVGAKSFASRALIRDQLDDHFNFPVVAHIEAATSYFSEHLHSILEANARRPDAPVQGALPLD